MSKTTTIFVALITAAVTSVLTVLVVLRFGLLPGFGPPEKVNVPDLSGLTQQDATANLQTLGLTVLIGGRKASSDKPAGSVLSQTPLAGSQVQAGTAITLVLADRPSKVPDISGRTVTEATLLLEQAGFQIQVAEKVFSDQIAPGKIASQVPPAGSLLESGRTVAVMPSDGPPPKAVPKLVGLGLGRAKQMIQDEGFQVGTIKWTYNDDYGSYAVLGQTPNPGEKARPGTAIELLVNED